MVVAMKTPKRKAALYADQQALDRLALQLMEWDPSMSLGGAYQAAMMEMERREKAKDPIPTA
jgi:hypothetical protein